MGSRGDWGGFFHDAGTILYIWSTGILGLYDVSHNFYPGVLFLRGRFHIMLAASITLSPLCALEPDQLIASLISDAGDC